MQRNSKITILIVVIFVALMAAILLTNKKDVVNNDRYQNNATNVDNSAYQESLDETENLPENAVLDPTQISVPDDLDWREVVSKPEFEVEFMTDQEKENLNLRQEQRVQVISRDEETGTILAYKVIESDDDIISGSE